MCSSTAQCIKSYFHSQRTVILRLTERGDRDTRLELSQHSSAWLSAGVIFSLSMLLDFWATTSSSQVIDRTSPFWQTDEHMKLKKATECLSSCKLPYGAGSKEQKLQRMGYLCCEIFNRNGSFCQRDSVLQSFLNRWRRRFTLVQWRVARGFPPYDTHSNTSVLSALTLFLSRPRITGGWGATVKKGRWGVTRRNGTEDEHEKKRKRWEKKRGVVTQRNRTMVWPIGQYKKEKKQRRRKKKLQCDEKTLGNWTGSIPICWDGANKLVIQHDCGIRGPDLMKALSIKGAVSWI